MTQTDITHRLRCKYPMGPIQANGEPEFGWRDFSGPACEGMVLPSPLMIEAADYIDAQAAEIERLRESITDYLQAQDAVDNNEYQSMPEDFGKLNGRRKAARDDLDAALSGEPT